MKKQDKTQDFLPDFGSFSIAIRLIFLAVVVALVITIGRNPAFDQQAWNDFNLLATFALIVSFGTVAVLKLMAPVISRMNTLLGNATVFLLLMVVAVVGVEATVFISFKAFKISLTVSISSPKSPSWRVT